MVSHATIDDGSKASASIQYRENVQIPVVHEFHLILKKALAYLKICFLENKLKPNVAEPNI